MKRDFIVRFDDVELVGGADNFFKDSKLTKVILRGGNKLSSLNSMFKGCVNLHTVEGSIDLEGMSTITSLFEGCSVLVDMPVLTCRGYVDMNNAFKNCFLLPTLKLENTTDLVIGNIEGAFDECHSLDGVEFYGTTSKQSINMLLDLFNPEE